MVGEGGAGGGDDAGRIDGEAGGDRLVERIPAIGVGAMEFEVVQGHAEIGEGAVGDAARG